MGAFERLNVWRIFGRITNSRFGLFIQDRLRKTVEKLMLLVARGEPQRGETTPFTPFEKDLGEARVALVTTTGVYVQGQEPFDVDSAKGDCTYRKIPSGVDVGDLRIAHTHYDRRRADGDINVIFPIERLRELAEEEVIGSVASVHFSYGFDLHVRELVDPSCGSAHEMARSLAEDGVDIALFTPG